MHGPNGSPMRSLLRIAKAPRRRATLRPGFAFSHAGRRGLPEKLLAGKTARIVVTMGMPGFLRAAWLARMRAFGRRAGQG